MGVFLCLSTQAQANISEAVIAPILPGFVSEAGIRVSVINLTVSGLSFKGYKMKYVLPTIASCHNDTNHHHTQKFCQHAMPPSTCGSEEHNWVGPASASIAAFQVRFYLISCCVPIVVCQHSAWLRTTCLQFQRCWATWSWPLTSWSSS